MRLVLLSLAALLFCGASIADEPRRMVICFERDCSDQKKARSPEDMAAARAQEEKRAQQIAEEKARMKAWQAAVDEKAAQSGLPDYRSEEARRKAELELRADFARTRAADAAKTGCGVKGNPPCGTPF